MNAAEPRADGENAVLPAAESVVAIPVPPGVGQQLRAERERQGLSIGDVAQRLKFAPRQIEAVEGDDFKALPGLTFVRCFVRGYAKLLNVDANPLVALLERSAGQDGGPSTVQLQSVSPTRAQFPAHATSHSAAWPWLLAIFLAIVGIGGYSIYYWQVPAALVPPHESRSPSPPAPERTESTVITPPPAPADDGRGSDLAQLAEPAQDAQGAAPSVARPEATQGKIRLMFNGESWTEIRDAGGKVVFSRKGAAGSEHWADGNPPFDLVVGNARETKLFYRGVEVDMMPYVKGSVARIQLK